MVNADHRMAQTLLKAPVEEMKGAGKQAFDDYVSKHKIVASLTTSPTRIKHIRPILDTLVHEKLFATVYLVLPRFYGKKKEAYVLPPWLNRQTYPKVTILTPNEDLGPISKMIFAVRELKKFRDKDAVVISVDDDTGYVKDTFNQLVKAIALNPNTVVGGSSQQLHFWEIDRAHAPHWSEAENSRVIEGTGAIAYRVNLVDDRLMEELVRGNRYCFVSDDLVISYALDRRKIKRLQVHNPYVGVDKNFPYSWGFGQDALHKGSGLSEASAANLNADKYQKCNDFLASRVEKKK
jgi:hypothetical protein